jgi:hypothetical protein
VDPLVTPRRVATIYPVPPVPTPTRRNVPTQKPYRLYDHRQQQQKMDLFEKLFSRLWYSNKPIVQGYIYIYCS